MENCSGKCNHCGGCGKNRVEDRITLDLGNREITNRDLVCKNCTYKKRGNTVSCYKFEKKPDDILEGANCEFFLKESISKNDSGCDGNCANCHCK